MPDGLVLAGTNWFAALERDPNYVQCLIDYAQFLQSDQSGKRDYKREVDAEKFIQRASACSMKGTRETTLAASTMQMQGAETQVELAFQVKPHETTLRIHSLLTIDDRLVWSGCENGQVFKWQRVRTTTARVIAQYCRALCGCCISARLC